MLKANKCIFDLTINHFPRKMCTKHRTWNWNLVNMTMQRTVVDCLTVGEELTSPRQRTRIFAPRDQPTAQTLDWGQWHKT